ncbi:hypothetical protein EON67_08005 [archaeon]|nr:MAG: hypothetical protein EON67_08005 [archaeon]
MSRLQSSCTGVQPTPAHRAPAFPRARVYTCATPRPRRMADTPEVSEPPAATPGAGAGESHAAMDAAKEALWEGVQSTLTAALTRLQEVQVRRAVPPTCCVSTCTSTHVCARPRNPCTACVWVCLTHRTCTRARVRTRAPRGLSAHASLQETQHVLATTLSVQRAEMSEGNAEWINAKAVLDRIPGTCVRGCLPHAPRAVRCRPHRVALHAHFCAP